MLSCFRRCGAAAALLLVLLTPRQGRAECRDLGGLGLMFGSGAGVATTVASSLVFPAIAYAVNPELQYGHGVGVGAAGGVTGTVIGTAIASSDCEPPEVLYIPSVFAASVAAVSVSIWAVVAGKDDEEDQVSVIARTSPDGKGVVLGLGGPL